MEREWRERRGRNVKCCLDNIYYSINVIVMIVDCLFDTTTRVFDLFFIIVFVSLYKYTNDVSKYYVKTSKIIKNFILAAE